MTPINESKCGARRMDAKEFSQLLQPVFPRARKFALSITRDEYDADDLVQESLTRAWLNFRRLRDSERFKPWLFSIIRQTHWAQLRAQLRRRSLYPQENIDQCDLDESMSARASHGASATLELRNVLAFLGEDDRHILLLSALGGVSVEELGRWKGCGVACMKKRMARARERARDERSIAGGRRHMSVALVDDTVAETTELLDRVLRGDGIENSETISNAATANG